MDNVMFFATFQTMGMVMKFTLYHMDPPSRARGLTCRTLINTMAFLSKESADQRADKISE
jgi:hypothetical protein